MILIRRNKCFGLKNILNIRVDFNGFKWVQISLKLKFITIKEKYSDSYKHVTAAIINSDCVINSKYFKKWFRNQTLYKHLIQ